MQIKVLGASHPDEARALEVFASLLEHPIPNVETTTVNLLGLMKGKRFVHTNMSRAFPGDANSESYEERRAAKLMAELEASDFNVLIDLHSIGAGGKRTAAISLDTGVSPIVRGHLQKFGVRNIVTTGFGLESYFPNSFTLEIPSEEVAENGVGFVRDFLDDLANNPGETQAECKDFTWFEFVRGLHVSSMHPDELTQDEWGQIEAFARLPERIEARLESEIPLHPMGCRRIPNENGFWADLFTPIAIPDATHWPK